MRTTRFSRVNGAGHVSALTVLMARYISGQVNESAWGRFSDAFDAVDASAEERLGFAAFYNDMFREYGPEAIAAPKKAELEDVLDIIRA